MDVKEMESTYGPERRPPLYDRVYKKIAVKDEKCLHQQPTGVNPTQDVLPAAALGNEKIVLKNIRDHSHAPGERPALAGRCGSPTGQLTPLARAAFLIESIVEQGERRR